MDYSVRRSIVFGLGLCLGCACSDETNAGEAQGGSAGVAGAGMAAGSGGAAGSGMLPSGGSGGAAMPTPDAGSMGGSGGAAGSGSSSNCPTIDPDPVPGQTIVIAAINVAARVLYIQNVSSAPIELTYPQWQWCGLPAYAPLVAENVTLAPGEIREISGLDGFSGDLTGSEMAVYDNVSFSDSDSMRAYVVWNQRLEMGREDVAAQAGLWTFLDRAQIDQGDVGLYATGPTDEGSGYTSVPASCFPLPR